MPKKKWIILVLILMSLLISSASASCASPYSGNRRKSGGDFSIDNCSCDGIEYPLSDSSRASTKSGTFSPGGDFEVPVTGKLHCSWEQEYSSDRKSDTITIDWDLYRLDFDDESNAIDLYDWFSNDIVDSQPDCESYGDCQAVASDHVNNRTFYFVKSVFIRGDGQEFPSAHYIWLSRFFDGPDGFYVLYLYMSHPELDMSDDSWRVLAWNVEDCAVDLVESD